MIRAIAFDAVGTLIHPDPPAWDVYAAVGRQFGSRVAADVMKERFIAAFGRQESVDFQAGLATDEARERQRWQAIVAEVLDDVPDPMACFDALYTHFAQPHAWRCAAETADVLHELRRRGYRLAIASNFDRRLRAVAAGLAELALVERYIISSEVGWRKPHGSFFAALAQSLNLPPAGVLVVGDDWANDYEGARRAGMRTVLLDPRGKHPEVGPDRIECLRDLLRPGILGD